MGLFSSSNSKHTELICDIGNGSVGLAVVEYAFDSKAPNIIFSERLYSKAVRVENLANTISVFDKNFNALLNNAIKYCSSKNIKLANVSCFYSSPWFVSETHVLKIKPVEPIIFSETIIKKMLEEAEKNFLSTEAIKLNPLELKDLKLVERRITRIKLNGYPTHSPVGKKTSAIEASLFLSAISEKIISIVETSIDRLWHKIKIQHHTFPLASFAMLRNEFNTHGSFLIAHIADNISDISIVNDEMLQDTFSFPIGKRNIIKSIEKECNLDYELASSAFSMYAKNEIHPEHIARFSGAVESVKKDWLTHFENACTVLTKNTAVPGTIYLIADEKVTPFFETAIKNFGFGSFAMSAKELLIYPVAKNAFNKYITYSLPIHKDFFLETEALYINLISPNQEKIIDNYILE